MIVRLRRLTAVPRFFVHFAAPTIDDAFIKIDEHGRAVMVVLHTDSHGGVIYGSAEITPEAKTKGGEDGHEDC